MAFVQKIWQNRVSDYPNRRRLAETGTPSVFELIREEGTVQEQGDCFCAATMNDLEERIAQEAQTLEGYFSGGKAKTALNSEKLGGTAASSYQLKDTALKWYDLELMNEFNPSTSQTPQYMRDNGGWVQVVCSFNRSTPPASFEQLAVLPQDYRPAKQIHVPVIAGLGTWSSYVTINPSGSINFYSGAIPSGWPNGALGFNVVFKTIV